jgi:hypothetical protein
MFATFQLGLEQEVTPFTNEFIIPILYAAGSSSSSSISSRE